MSSCFTKGALVFRRVGADSIDRDLKPESSDFRPRGSGERHIGDLYGNQRLHEWQQDLGKNCS